MTAPVARELLKQRTTTLFSERFSASAADDGTRVGAGDAIEVSVWEAPPAALFPSATSDMTSPAPATARGVTLPEQLVAADGRITVPFAGRIVAAGRSLQQIEQDIVQQLRGKANQPQVLVRRPRNSSSTVAVIGDVQTSTQVAITPRGERLLDVLAAAGGVRNPVDRTTVQITRQDTVMALPLDVVIRDPRQNVSMRAGDVVTVLNEPLSFMAVGATGKNDEIKFEAQGITLAQAIARSGGVQDNRGDAQGVFIFRFEDQPPAAPGALNDGVAGTKTPVIYTLDLKDPASFFVMQTFKVQNKDMLYVANAPLAEFQKFANAVFSIVFPLAELSVR